MNSTWIRYVHTVEIWEKNITTNAAGQKLPNYEYQKTVPCFYVPISARERQGPTYENRNRDQLFIPPTDGRGDKIILTYDHRLKNVKDRTGRVIRGDSPNEDATDDPEMYDIHMLIKHTGWGGKLRFYQLMVLTSVEP